MKPLALSLVITALIALVVVFALVPVCGAWGDYWRGS